MKQGVQYALPRRNALSEQTARSQGHIPAFIRLLHLTQAYKCAGGKYRPACPHSQKWSKAVGACVDDDDALAAVAAAANAGASIAAGVPAAAAAAAAANVARQEACTTAACFCKVSRTCILCDANCNCNSAPLHAWATPRPRTPQ